MSEYVVKGGDTLSGIAGRVLGDANRWPEIYRLNQAEMDKAYEAARPLLRNAGILHPSDYLRAGQKLALPRS